MSHRRVALSRSASFCLMAVVLALSLWTSGAPAMMYPLCLDGWGATPLTTTALFSTYPVALVITLVVLGAVSDVVGRRPVLLAGMAVAASGTIVFATAASMPWLFAGRGLQGAGVGMTLSAAAAALAEFDRSVRPQRVSAVNTAATSIGAALAILIGGALVEFSPSPASTPFLVLLVVTVAALVGVWFLPDTVRSGERWQPRWPTVPEPPHRAAFFVGVFTIASAFVMGGVFLALGAQIARDLVGSDNAFLTALALATWPIMGIPAAMLSHRLSAPAVALSGGVLAAIGSALLLPAGGERSLTLFLVASLLSGLGYGLMFSSGFARVTGAATTAHRAGNLSTMYLIVYGAQGAGAIAIGALATRFGLATALSVGMPTLAALCITAAILNGSRRRL